MIARKSLQLLILTTLGLGIGMPAHADVIYKQKRAGNVTLTDGLFSQAGIGARAFDNFTLDGKKEVRGISFTFAALGGPLPTFANRRWTVKFFEANGSRPGNLLTTVKLGGSMPTNVGTDSGAVFYDMDYKFSKQQRFELAGGTEYWVSIVSRQTPDNTMALWSAAKNSGDGSIWKVNGSSIPSSADRAFSLKGVTALPEAGPFAFAAIFVLIGVGIVVGVRRSATKTEVIS